MDKFKFIAAVHRSMKPSNSPQGLRGWFFSISAIAFSQMFHSNGDGCILKHVGKCHSIRMQMPLVLPTHPFWTNVMKEDRIIFFCTQSEHSLGIFRMANGIISSGMIFRRTSQKYNWCRNIHNVFDTMNASSSNNLLQFNVVYVVLAASDKLLNIEGCTGYV